MNVFRQQCNYITNDQRSVISKLSIFLSQSTYMVMQFDRNKQRYLRTEDPVQVLTISTTSTYHEFGLGFELGGGVPGSTLL